MKIEEKIIDNIEALIKAIQEANTRFQGQVWWRGQGCYDWQLSPSIARNDRGYEYEQNTIFRFMRRAPSRFSPTPIETDIFSWLFLMQHHRLPTRLLDWTESPLIGCYFAIENEETINQDGALFALSPYELNRQQIGIYAVLNSYHEKSFLAAQRAFSDKANDVNYVVAIMPNESHIRVMVQMSVFTLHGSGLILDDLSGTDSYLIKYKIPPSVKPLLREQLKMVGIRESNLFPDLDHLANETKSIHFAKPPDLESPKETESPITTDLRIEYGSSSG